MKKQIDWNAEAKRARKMDASELTWAIADALETAVIWDRAGRADTDGNAGFYRDQASVYQAERNRRAS